MPTRDLRTLDARRIARLAEQPAVSGALRWFARERNWINEQHLQLCRIAAPTFFEQKRAEWFRQQLDSFGWTANLDRAGNVVATFGPSRDQRQIVVSAHLDTVFAPPRPEAIYFAPDGRLMGPGASDNGSGLSAVLALARVLGTTASLHEMAGCMVLAANVGEEGEGNLSGMRFLCQSGLDVSSIIGFVVLDGPAVDHVTALALASHRFEVVFSGPGGHTWNDQGTPNPVHAMCGAVTEFLRSVEERIPEEKRKTSSCNFSVIEGGTSINAIPAAARAKLDLRSEDGAVLDELGSLLTPAVERTLERENRSAGSARLTAKVRDLGARPGGKLPSDAPLLRAIQAVDAHLQIRSRLLCASTDANLPLSMSLPAISIGAGGQGGGAHTEGEWYQPEGREVGLRRVFLLLAALATEGVGIAL